MHALQVIERDNPQRPQRQVDPFCMCLVCVLGLEVPAGAGTCHIAARILVWEIHKFDLILIRDIEHDNQSEQKVSKSMIHLTYCTI